MRRSLELTPRKMPYDTWVIPIVLYIAQSQHPPTACQHLSLYAGAQDYIVISSLVATRLSH